MTQPPVTRAVEDLLRELSPQVLGALARQEADFAACEDAVQEALLDASVQWPAHGVPGNPRGWLLAAGRRRLIDAHRSDAARRRRERREFMLSRAGPGRRRPPPMTTTPQPPPATTPSP